MRRAAAYVFALTLALSLGVADTAQAATTTRTCALDNGRVWNQVTVTTYPHNPVAKRRIVRISSREYYVQAAIGPDAYYRLRYVGLRGTSREWYRSTLPTSYWSPAGVRSWTFYWALSRWPIPFASQLSCTVSL